MTGLVKAAQARAEQDAPSQGAGRTREVNRAATSKVLGTIEKLKGGDHRPNNYKYTKP
jgi:hypothetical protein